MSEGLTVQLHKIARKSSSICGDYLHIIIFAFSCSSLAYRRNTFTLLLLLFSFTYSLGKCQAGACRLLTSQNK